MDSQTIQFLVNNGVAVGMLAAVVFGAYVVGKAIAKGIQHLFDHVAIPMKDAAIKHLDDTGKYLEKTSDAIDSLKCTLDRIDSKLPSRPKTDP